MPTPYIFRHQTDGTQFSLDEFTRAYLECALWSSMIYTEEGDTDSSFLDANYDIEDFSISALNSAIEECKAFQRDNAGFLSHAGDDGQNGHDFWLTRNHHGAGFWDRGYNEKVSRELTDAAHHYGSVDYDVNDDGLIYC